VSIRFKLALVIAMAVLAATGAASLVFLSLQYSSLRQAEEERISILKADVANMGSESLMSSDSLMLLDYLTELRRHYQEIVGVRVNPGTGWHDVGQAAPAEEIARSRREMITARAGGKSVLVQLLLSRQVLERNQRRARESLTRNIMSAVAAVALAALLVSYLLGWTMTRRIVRIEAILREIGGGRVDARVEARGRDEIGHLARGVNEMAERLQELDKLKKTFIASVTHELRSPLGVIESHVKTLLADPVRLAPQERDNLHRIMGSVNRLSHFVTNLLDMAKIERGALDFVPRDIHIGELVEDAVLFFQPKAAEARIALSCASEKGIVLRADPDLVSHVLTNLISNALKFTRPEGKIIVSLKRVPGGVECSVADSGVGIPPEGLARVFKPFQRVNNPLRATGVGLGLAISKNIMDMHGGRIGAESAVGRGSRFYFFLPEKGSSSPQ
jgi:signal transduction histidine kinase